MAEYTENFNLIKPGQENFYNVENFNNNADIIDAELKKLENNKVDKVEGKQLSTEDYTTEEKQKLAGIEEEADKTTKSKIEDALGYTPLSDDELNDLAGEGRTTETVKSAYDLAQQAFQSASDGKQKIAGAITGKGVPTSPSDTFETMANNINAIETDKTGDATAVAADIRVGKTAYARGNKLVGTIPENTVKQTITTQGGQINLPEGIILPGSYVKAQFPNLVPENIKQGVNVGGVAGNLFPIDESGTFTIELTDGESTSKTIWLSSPLAPYDTVLVSSITRANSGGIYSRDPYNLLAGVAINSSGYPGYTKLETEYDGRKRCSISLDYGKGRSYLTVKISLYYSGYASLKFEFTWLRFKRMN